MLNKIDSKALIREVRREFHKKIIGQENLLNGFLISLLCQGHVLLEGVPGIAKTLAVKTFAEIIDLSFKRIQFTPDLLPADILGTEVYNPKKGTFSTKKGPLFTNIVLADEINRAPSKVQSALLEAMQEKQITIGETTYPLNLPFMVLATQNPIEQEGTYNLPEAQIDRFIFKIKIPYPQKDEELAIIKKNLTGEITKKTKAVLKISDIAFLTNAFKKVHLENKIIEYIVNIVRATREQEKALISFGASPRASIFLTEAAKAYAFLQEKNYVTPDDVKEMAHSVLEHRIMLSYEAEAENVSKKELIDALLLKVKVP